MKNNAPLIALALLIVLGIAYWLTQGNDDATTSVPGEVATTTEEEAGGSNEGTRAPSTSVGTPSSPLTPPVGVTAPSTGGVNVVAYWATFDNAKWHFTFKYRTDWESGVTKSEDGDITQASFSSDDGSILVSRNIPIAEPAGLTAQTRTRTVAGQSVEVREYENPNENYKYYQYLTLQSGNYEYYVSIRSKTTAKSFAEDFLSRIATK